jgi:hypothetical protein
MASYAAAPPPRAGAPAPGGAGAGASADVATRAAPDEKATVNVSSRRAGLFNSFPTRWCASFLAAAAWARARGRAVPPISQPSPISPRSLTPSSLPPSLPSHLGRPQSREEWRSALAGALPWALGVAVAAAVTAAAVNRRCEADNPGWTARRAGDRVGGALDDAGHNVKRGWFGLNRKASNAADATADAAARAKGKAAGAAGGAKDAVKETGWWAAEKAHVSRWFAGLDLCLRQTRLLSSSVLSQAFCLKNRLAKSPSLKPPS